MESIRKTNSRSAIGLADARDGLRAFLTIPDCSRPGTHGSLTQAGFARRRPPTPVDGHHGEHSQRAETSWRYY